VQITVHIESIQHDLAAAAALGDEASAEAGRKLSIALESSLHVRLLDVLTEAAAALSAQLPSGHVELRLAGRDPELVFVEDEPAAASQPAAGDESLTARITLRLPEALKASVEAAAGREGVSTNTWLVRAVARGLEPRPGRHTPGRNRLQGFAQS
jgi:hypothetical protein